MNKKYIYVAALLSALTILPGQAQERKIYNNQIIVVAQELRQEGDSLYLSMEINWDQLALKSHSSLTLVPILTNESNYVDFPTLVINGRNRHKAYMRQQSLDKIYPDERPYAIVKANHANHISYAQQIPFEGWMENAHFELVEDECGCAGKNENSARNLIFNGVDMEVSEVYQVQPRLVYIQPQVEEIKKRSEMKEVFLDFKVGSSAILPELNQNYSELHKVGTMLQEVKNDKNITVQSIRFRGYASPEGSVTSNQLLSLKRADAMRNYLIDKYSLTYQSSAEGYGEDWDGLKKLLSDSDIPSKGKLMDIIEVCGTSDACEQKLKTVGDRTPYLRMLKEIYPQLRRTICNVDYTVRGFSVEEGREIIKKSPQQLSLNEMYLVANSYEEGSKEFDEVFETAVRMFPEDDVANLNAAISAINRNDLVLAQKYLDRVENQNGEYANSQGVLYLLKGDYDNAEIYLNKATSEGIEAAYHNLGELHAKRENNSLWEKRKWK